MKLGVLASGTGSILEAMIAAALDICVVVVDRECRAQQVASDAGIPEVCVRRTSFGAAFDRVTYTKEVTEVLLNHDAGVVAIAGFGTILAEPIHEAYPGRVLNTHPSLLPSFKGWHAVEDALGAGVKVTGCTVHVITAEVDEGPILAQEAVPVLADDTVETLHERIKSVERRLYPQTVATFIAECEATH